MTLASSGFPTLLVALPFLCERVPTGQPRGYAYMSTEGEVALPAYEQAVSDIRAALDWLLTRPECTRDRRPELPGPAVVGVSFGALVAVIAAALEPRFESLVTILAGGDLDIIVFRGAYHTTVPGELRQAEIKLEARRRARDIYEDYIKEVRRAPHPLAVQAAFHFYLFDPLTFASHLRNRPALMINGRFDPIIPRLAVEQLWLELGKPEISWLWGTHWAGGPWKPFVVRRIARFLKGLGPHEFRRPADSWARPWTP